MLCLLSPLTAVFQGLSLLALLLEAHFQEFFMSSLLDFTNWDEKMCVWLASLECMFTCFRTENVEFGAVLLKNLKFLLEGFE